MEDPKMCVDRLQRQERTRSAHTGMLQYLSVSSEHRIHTMNGGVHFKGSIWKSASGALKI